MKVSRIVREYREAGSLNSLIALWGFVDETTFLTKSGHVGLVYRMDGVDFEGLTHAQRRSIAHRFEAALRLLDERCRVYQYLLKRTMDSIEPTRCSQTMVTAALAARAAYLNSRAKNLYLLDGFLVLVYEPSGSVRTRPSFRQLRDAPAHALRSWLSTSGVLSLIAHELDRGITMLHEKAAAIEVHLADVGLRRLPKAEAFIF